MKLFVGNIPYVLREEEFADICEKFGSIESLVFKQGFAFVEYNDEQQAKDAIESLNGKEVDGRRLRAEEAVPGTRSRRDGNSGEASANLFVANIPEGTTESELNDFFGKFGKVQSVKILPQRGGANALSGFVDFEDVEGARAAHDAEKMLGDNLIRSDYNNKSRFQQRNNRYDNDRYDNRRGGGYRNEGHGRYNDRPRYRSRSPRGRSRSYSPRGRSPSRSPRRGDDDRRRRGGHGNYKNSDYRRSRSPDRRRDHRARSPSRSPRRY